MSQTIRSVASLAMLTLIFVSGCSQMKPTTVKKKFLLAAAEARLPSGERLVLPLGTKLASYATVTPRVPWLCEPESKCEPANVEENMNANRTGLQMISSSIPTSGNSRWDTFNNRIDLPASTGSNWLIGPSIGLLYTNVKGRGYVASCHFEFPAEPSPPSLGLVSWGHVRYPPLDGSGTFAGTDVTIAISPDQGGIADLRIHVPAHSYLKRCELYGYTLAAKPH